jgi:uncharacterized membrane protein
MAGTKRHFRKNTLLIVIVIVLIVVLTYLFLPPNQSVAITAINMQPNYGEATGANWLGPPTTLPASYETLAGGEVTVSVVITNHDQSDGHYVVGIEPNGASFAEFGNATMISPDIPGQTCSIGIAQIIPNNCPPWYVAPGASVTFTLTFRAVSTFDGPLELVVSGSP